MEVPAARQFVVSLTLFRLGIWREGPHSNHNLCHSTYGRQIGAHSLGIEKTTPLNVFARYILDLLYKTWQSRNIYALLSYALHQVHIHPFLFNIHWGIVTVIKCSSQLNMACGYNALNRNVYNIDN